MGTVHARSRGRLAGAQATRPGASLERTTSEKYVCPLVPNQVLLFFAWASNLQARKPACPPVRRETRTRQARFGFPDKRYNTRNRQEPGTGIRARARPRVPYAAEKRSADARHGESADSRGRRAPASDARLHRNHSKVLARQKCKRVIGTIGQRRFPSSGGFFGGRHGVYGPEDVKSFAILYH